MQGPVRVILIIPFSTCLHTHDDSSSSSTTTSSSRKKHNILKLLQLRLLLQNI